MGGTEPEAFAKALYMSLHGAGAMGCLRARPTDSLRVIAADSLRVIAAAEFVGLGRVLMGIEEYLAVKCPCWDEADVVLRHARIRPRAERR